jgi:hypothetical protein
VLVEESLSSPEQAMDLCPPLSITTTRSLRARGCLLFRTSIFVSRVKTHSSLMFTDFLKKVNSDFPYSNTRGGRKGHYSRKSYMIKSLIEPPPETVEEEKIEEEEV